MRTLCCLLLITLTGCSGPDGDPLRVAERFHTLRSAGQDREIHALLTEADRAAIPLEAFPVSLPLRAMQDYFSWGDTRLDSVTPLGSAGDTAAVVLHVPDAADDTVRLVAANRPLRLLGLLEIDRTRWRVHMGLAEHARMDSLAAAVRAHDEASDGSGAEQARAYLELARRLPDLAAPREEDIARSILRRAEAVRALRFDLEVGRAFTGTRFVQGEVENGGKSRVATVRLVVRDTTGREERVELWDLPGGRTIPVRQLTGLREGPLTWELERVQVF